VTTSSNSRSVRARRIASPSKSPGNARVCPPPSFHGGEKCARVDEVESAAERIACRHEIDRSRHCSRGSENILRPRVPAEPFKKRVATERHADRESGAPEASLDRRRRNPAYLVRIAE